MAGLFLFKRNALPSIPQPSGRVCHRGRTCAGLLLVGVQHEGTITVLEIRR